MEKYAELTDEQVEELFGSFVGCTADEVVKTHETLDDWRRSANGYFSHGGLSNDLTGDADMSERHPVLVIRNVQLQKGQTRNDIVIIDMGEYRLVYSPFTIRD